MGWAKRFWEKKRAELGTEAPLTQAGFERLDQELVPLLGDIDGCLELLERLDLQHQGAGSQLRGDERRVHEMVLAAGRGLTRENLESLFEQVEDELPRTLLAQTLLALYSWDPPCVVFTSQDFDEQMQDCLAVQDLIERLAHATGGKEAVILESLPDSLGRRVMSYGVLNTMNRPLGLLAPSFRARDLELPLPGVGFDGVLFERDLERGGAGRRLLLQSEPIAEESLRALEQGQIEFLRFYAEEITGSFRSGTKVVKHVTTRWGWRPLGGADEAD